MDKPGSYYISLVAALLVLLGLNLFFSFCETGFSSSSRIKLKNMAAQTKQKRKAKMAQRVLNMLDSYDKLLSTILIGNTILNITASALATVLFIGLFGSHGVTVTSIVMTLVVLIFCEIAPKTLAKESPELTALRAAPLLRLLFIIFTPLSFLAASWQKFIIRIFPAKDDRSLTEDELLTFVEEVRQEGGINKDEEQMIRQVIEFDDITAAEIVTPRVDVAAIPENATANEIDRKFGETGFSRLPVFRDSIDSISGVILLKDFHHEVINKGRLPSDIIKPVVFVTKTMKISALLHTLQNKQAHLAVLVDEFGGTLGIVTIEDIVEELVGEIWDEHDEVQEPFRKNADNSVSTSGSAKFQDMLEFLGYSATDEEVPATTIANWIMENSGTVPRVGEKLNWLNLEITVSKVHKHRILETTIQIRN